MKKNVFFFLFCVFNQTLFGQGVPVGEWRNHSSYNSASHVASLGEKIYASTEFGLAVYNKKDNSVFYLSKINGLSDVGLSCVATNNLFDLVLIGYENGNIDLIINEVIVNVPYLLLSSVSGNKSILNAYEEGAFLYLACSFGVIVFDCEKKEIKDTFLFNTSFFNCSVNDVCVFNNLLFVSTTTGVYWGDLNDNLLDNNNWFLVENLPLGDFNSITPFLNTVVVNYSSTTFNSDTLFQLHPDFSVSLFGLSDNYVNRSLSSQESFLTLCNYFSVRVFNENKNVVNNISSLNPNEALLHSNELWIADNSLGLVKNWDGWRTTSFAKNGYGSGFVSEIKTLGNSVWVAPGGINSSWINLFIKDGLWLFTENKWVEFSYESLFFSPDIVSVLPVENGVFCGSWGGGLIKIKNNTEISLFDNTNSSLQSVSSQVSNSVRVGGLALDGDENIWISNSEVSAPLSVFTNEGSWASFSFGSLVPEDLPVRSVLVDDHNQVWMQLRYSGILVLNTNNTPLDSFDDVYKKISASVGQGNLPSNSVLCLTKDLDGFIWVGTDQGLSVFYNPSLIFTSEPFDSQSIIVEQGGYVEELFEDVSITAIAVDGGNQKWIGTSNGGVFLLSSDGSKEILHFTKENSPLFSNTITSIGVQEETGEVFIGTDRGLVSYRGGAIVGKETFSGIYVFPNPVKEDYFGLISVSGLLEESVVKITDISGNLVFQTNSLGGLATWDGLLPNGKRPKTGVYLVFVSTPSGSFSEATKFLFVN